MKTKLEICCGSADDCVAAAAAGADRVELNSAMFVGGLTPSIGETLTAKAHAAIPIVCMLRPRPGGFCYSALEFETMLRDADALIAAGADGLAFGVLTEDGRIDAARCRELVARCAGRGAVFHRAFDCAQGGLLEDADLLADLGVTRILTSGRRANCEAGVENLRALVAHGGTRIEILPGGGIRPRNAHTIVKETACTQLHCSFHVDSADWSATHNPALRFNAPALPAEEVVRVVDRDGLAAFVASLV